MSSNVLKDKIIELLANIIDESKPDNLLLSELQELLLQLKNITVFDGLKLFIETIESKTTFERHKIEVFLARNLYDLSLFPKLYDFIESKHIEVQDSIVLEETRGPVSEQDDYKDITDELKEGLKSGGGLRSRVEIADEESERTKAQLREEMGAKLGVPDGKSSSSKPPKLPGGVSSSSKQSLPPIKSSAAASFGSTPPPTPAPMAKTLFSPPRTPEPQPKAPPKLEKVVEKKAKKSKPRKEEKSLKKEKEAVNKELEDILLDESKRSVLIDYYSRMNINQVYDFSIKVDRRELQAKKKQTDFITGEQREQVTEEITVEEDEPIEVELSIPGCLVSPSIQYVSPEAQSSQVTFYVTPYVKFSKRPAKVIIGQKKLEKKTIPLQVSVIDRRVMKMFSVLGLLIASIPSVWPYVFGPDLNQQIFWTLSNYSSLITNELIVPIEVALGGFITVVSFLWYKIYSSKRSSFNQSI